jgi:branched-chain amino acid transport system substrate-binding protein
MSSKVTSKKMIAAIIAIIIIVAAVVIVMQQQQPSEEVVIRIGIMADLSGPLTTYGEDIRDAALIGSENINAYFEKEGKPYRVQLFVEDTKVDPKIALDKIQALHGKGINLIIGPMGSGEVKQILEYASANKIILVSPSSTAPNEFLGVTTPEERQYVFRFVALDTVQTIVITQEAADLGIKGVVMTNIGNAWGKGLVDYSADKFEVLGIEVKESVEYPEPPPADFTPNIAILESSVQELLQKYDTSEVAVVALSYEEVYTILSQIDADSPLLDVTWIGCDGTAKSRRISEIPDKVNTVGMYSTLFHPPKGQSFDQLDVIYQERFGRDIFQYALNGYDAQWVIALSFAEVYEQMGKYDPDAMAETIPLVTVKYSREEYGFDTVSGYIGLDEFNDRASGDFAIWAVENGEWALKGIFKFEENKIEWE